MDDISNICELIFSATAQTSSFWKFYSTVSLATIGYVMAAKAPLESFKVRVGVAVVFFIFAMSNSGAIKRSQIQNIAVHEFCTKIAVEKLGENSDFVTALNQTAPSPVCQIMIFHYSVDVGVILIVIMIPRFRKTVHETVALDA
ncbi:hypothetical protein [uncultured Gimesia sp.]|uniref:hypothetical protein n=1 Tax=uncultured Gimesia sp. TaxID=1678688 RepID=UPI0030D9C267|tara:strand:+ start:6109 stop:6540 length:432 start_codon:yes stop_codon:yes gene_type:complete